MELADRNALVVLIDSIGYQAAFEGIIKELGHNTNIIACEYFQHCDKKHEYDQRHWQREAIKTQRYHQKMEMIKKGVRQLEEDAHEQVDYGPSQALEDIFESMAEEPLAKRRKRTQTGSVICPHPLCKLKGHKTKHSLKCLMNPNNPNYVGPARAGGLGG